MLINQLPFENLTLENLHYLIDNQIIEYKQLEYKQELNIDSDRKEFLSDIVSFSNASGGIIIYGIKEEKGIPIDIPGISISDFDSLKQKIENIIRDSIDPRIIVNISKIDNPGKNPVLLIKILNSWNAPHMIRANGRFFSRNSAGRYPMDRDQIKNLMLENESLLNLSKDFHNNRIKEFIEGRLPTINDSKPRLIINSIPFSYRKQNIDISIFRDVKYINEYFLELGLFNKRFNYFGFWIDNKPRELPSPDSHIQIFRNGIIEHLICFDESSKQNKKFMIGRCEQNINSTIKILLKIQQHINVDLPIIILTSLLNVKGYGLEFDRIHSPAFDVNSIENDILLLPEIIIDDYSSEYKEQLNCMFNTIWNAAGFPFAKSIDENGNWKFY